MRGRFLMPGPFEFFDGGVFADATECWSFLKMKEKESEKGTTPSIGIFSIKLGLG